MHDLQCVHQCTCLKYGHIHTESGVGVYVLIPLTIPDEYFTEHNCVTESVMPEVHVSVCGRAWRQGCL